MSWGDLLRGTMVLNDRGGALRFFRRPKTAAQPQKPRRTRLYVYLEGDYKIQVFSVHGR